MILIILHTVRFLLYHCDLILVHLPTSVRVAITWIWIYCTGLWVNKLHKHDDVIKWKRFPRSPVIGEFPTQWPVTRSFDVFFDLHPNKRLSKQFCGWWFVTPSHPLWRHFNESVWIPQQNKTKHGNVICLFYGVYSTLWRLSAIMNNGSFYWHCQWLGAVRQQAITWASVDLDPCRHMTSLGHNQLSEISIWVSNNVHCMYLFNYILGRW